MRNGIRFGIALFLGLSMMGCSSLMRSAMVAERASPYDMQETIKTISERARQHGWNVSAPKKLEENIRKHGGPIVSPVSLVELCEPHYAAKLLASEHDRWVSVFMPCTISIYTKSDGRVYVANVKAANVGGLLGGTVAEVMGGPVAATQEEILSFLQ